jgi:hypothetical protein
MWDRSRPGTYLLAAILCGLGATPAWAPVSLGLEEVLVAVKDEPRLAHEVDVELRRRDLRAREIVCVAARHGGHWAHLGGGRAAPYECQIGDRRLRIEALRTYYDGNGRRLGRLGEVPDKRLFERARSYRETSFRWTWSP